MYSFYDEIQGFSDFRAGKSISANPYKNNGEREAWLKGWYDAYIVQINTEYVGATRFIEIKRKPLYQWHYS